MMWAPALDYTMPTTIARDAGDQLGSTRKITRLRFGGKPDGRLDLHHRSGKKLSVFKRAYTEPTGGASATCTNAQSVYGDPDAAEQLLRYIADIGDDGDMATGHSWTQRQQLLPRGDSDKSPRLCRPRQ